MLYLRNFIELLFPRICAACGNNLLHQEEMICTKCLNRLPKTNFHEESSNKAAQIFYGRVHLEQVVCFLYFKKHGLVQEMLHQLKYKGKCQLGVFLGKLYGFDLRVFARQYKIDMIIPVPLHPKKMRKRGFNQAECLGQGLSESMGIPMETNLIQRLVHNPTQTRKSKYQRWENVSGIFQLVDKKKVAGKHILLVDDVLTTGSTMEALAVALKESQSTRVSIATLAFADL